MFKIISICCALMVVNNSLLKLVYPSSIFNFILLASFFVLFIFQKHPRKYVLRVCLLCFILYFMVIISAFYPDASLDSIEDIIKLLSLPIYILGGYYSAKSLDVKFILIFQSFLGLAVISLHFLGFYDFYAAGGNYIMLGISVMISAISSYWLGLAYGVKGFFLISLILVISLLFLNSRSALGLTVIIMFIMTIQLKLNSKHLHYSIMYMMVFLIILKFAFDWLLKEGGSLSYTLYKFKGMLSGSYEDERSNLYKTAINLIIEQPFGYGLSSHSNLLGYYPHNFFLEVTLNFGIVLSVYYCFLFSICTLKQIPFLNKLNVIMKYFLISFGGVWLVSFNYSSSFQIHYLIGICLYLFVFENKVHTGRS
jgi:hypothetical protein